MTDGIERKDQNPGARKPTLTLNRTQSGGTVKQSFSHGRSKQVAVEVKTRRTVAAPPNPAQAGAPARAPASAAPAAPRPQGGASPGAAPPQAAQTQAAQSQAAQAQAARAQAAPAPAAQSPQVQAALAAHAAAKAEAAAKALAEQSVAEQNLAEQAAPTDFEPTEADGPALEMSEVAASVAADDIHSTADADAAPGASAVAPEAAASRPQGRILPPPIGRAPLPGAARAQAAAQAASRAASQAAASAAPAQPSARPSGAGAGSAPARPGGGRGPSAAGPAPLANRSREITTEEQRRRQEAVQRSLQDQQVRLERQRQDDAQRRAREEAARRLHEEEQERQRLLNEQQRQVDEVAAAEAAAREAAKPPEARAAARDAAARGANGGEVDQAARAGEADRAPERSNSLLAELGGRVKPAKKAPLVAAVKPARDKNAEGRRTGRLTLDMVDRAIEGEDDKVRSLAAMRRAREKERERRMKGVGSQQAEVQKRDVIIPEAITIQELSNRMATRAADIIKYMMRQGQMVTINDVLDADTAELVATDFGHAVKRVAESDVEEGLEGIDDTDEQMLPRPPVVTVMGHVDHGKTSLLDALRHADVAAGEAGGITQHIGAYQVRLENGQRVTFLDTPGHAAFSNMRMRGAQVTDIVILVVAADDGVMPQTIEAISHAKAAGVPIIVAVNKIDKDGADPQKVLNELLQYEIITEAVGGDVQAVNVSALKKLGLTDLVEAIIVQAEVLDLKANPDRSAEASVIEAKLDRGRGSVATVLVSRGTLKRGDIVVAGAQWGRVRALVNERGQQVTSAGPSEPVEIMGLEGVPDPGDPVVVVENEMRAREIVEFRQRKRRDKLSAGTAPRTSLEQMMARFKTDDAKELAVVVKADVQGSAEAIQSALERLSTDEVRARVMHSGVGAINESDIVLAKASGAPIIGFNVRASKEARELAERENVEIRYYAIIYDVIDDVKGVMSGMLAPLERETALGEATILQVFNISKVGRVAGCLVKDGKMVRGQRIRLLRDNVVIHEGGKLNTLQRFKDSVNEVQTGQECGMSFENYQDLKAGDVIECYSLEIVQRSL